MKTTSKFFYVLILCLTLLIIVLSTQLQFYNSFFGDDYIRLKTQKDDMELLYPLSYVGSDFEPILDLVIKAKYRYESLLGIDKEDSKDISIAVVDNTCGPGCGELDGNRIEIDAKRFDVLVENIIEKEQADHLLFYELGRIYWSFDKQLSCDNPKLNKVMHTGFAIFMRDQFLKEVELTTANFNGMNYKQYMDVREQEYKVFLEQSEFNFLELVESETKYVEGVALKSTRICASILSELCSNDEKDVAIRLFFKSLEQGQKAKNCEDVMDNLMGALEAASSSSGK